MSIADLSPAERHRAVASGFTEHVVAVTEWDAPTPVDEWTARDVVAHLVEWFPGFLAGGGVELSVGEHDTGDPAARWRAHTAAVQALLDGPRADDTFGHPMVGEHRLADAIDRFYTADVFMHTWDLAAAVGRDADLDPEFAEQLHDGMVDVEELLRSSGQYGPAVPVADTADPVTRLVAFIGRDPSWRQAP
ncbi:maleylpyruvate isomerase N-terminal domain-containing protein [Gordonia sp. CPCC 205515]|uniref:maleylpyruvate isomerase N-terminal domain-containing protein n=1 Tax=Gordonia sp. CPCC 205515 TaxID=3140791 RepID=UPI003AF37694